MSASVNSRQATERVPCPTCGAEQSRLITVVGELSWWGCTVCDGTWPLDPLDESACPDVRGRVLAQSVADRIVQNAIDARRAIQIPVRTARPKKVA
jgi:hypothetical protein